MAQHQYKPRASGAGKPKADEAAPKLKLVYTSAAAIRATNTRWLWKDQIPLGKLTLIAGDPKIGKSQITADMAATVALGHNFPDGSRAVQGGVLILSAEDDATDTIKPRLMASGLDTPEALEWVDIVDGLSGADGKEQGFDFTAGYEAIEQYARDHEDLKLVIIDPVMAYMGRRDAHKAAEVRDALMPYVKLAQDHGFAIVAVTHLNRGSSNHAFDRVLGSGAFAQIARMCFLVTKDEDEGRCLFTPFGGNLAPLGEAFAFNIERAVVHGDDGDSIITSRVRWSAERVPITAQEALERTTDARQGNTRRKHDDAAELILTALTQASGEMRSTQLKQRVLDAGITEGTYEKAHKALRASGRIKAEKGEGYGAPWSTKLVGV